MRSVGGKLTVVLILWTVISVCLSADSSQKESAKTASQSNDSSVFKMFDLSCLEPMQVVDWLRSGALVLGFLAILFWDGSVETWLQAELLFVGSQGAMAFFAPAALLDFQSDGPTNAVHEMTVQAIGSMVLGLCFLHYASTKDTAVRNLNFVILSIATTVLFVTHAYGHYKYAGDKTHFNLQHCSFAMLGGGLYLFGNFVQLYRANRTGTPATNVITRGGLNSHLLIDGFLFILFGFLDFGFPEFALSFVNIAGFKPDGVLATFQRHGGVLEILCGLQAIFYCGLQSDVDKRALLRSRLVMYLFVYPLLFLYQWKHAMFTRQDFILTIVMSGFIFGNSLCALYINVPKQKRR